MQRVLRLSVLAVLAGAFLLVVPESAGAGLQPNDSVFFFKPGLGVTGTIHNGVFTQNPTNITNNMSGWTSAAASRDTLLLLNGSTGQLQLGTFTAGVYTPVSSSVPILVATSFSKMTASCDTFLVYSPSTGKLGTARVSAGVLDTGHFHVYTVAKNFTSVNASCNTVTLLNNQGNGIVGTLKAGVFTKKGPIKTGIANPLVVHTDTSFVRFSTSSHKIEWGTSNNGVEKVTVGPAFEVSTVTKLAATATSTVLYDGTTGMAATAELVNGVISNSQTQSFSAGWQVIVGGR